MRKLPDPLPAPPRPTTSLPPCVYVRADYAGNRYRFIFAPVERLGRIPLVLYFLQEVCKANAEKSEPNT